MKKQIPLKFKYPEFILPAIDDQSHYVMVPAGRQTGKTYNFVQWLIVETMEQDCPSLWVDTVHANIDKYIERYFKPILGELWSHCDWNAQKKVLKLPRGYIDFGSSQKPENLEGFNYKRCVLNEAGHILNKVGLWDNTIMPMIKADDNKTRIIGTPKGMNKFHDLYQLGMGDNPEYKSYKYTVYDSPFWTKEQIEEIRKVTPEVVWNQEYMGDFESFKGLIYPDFKEELHVKDSERQLTDIYFVGLDVGWNHPTACLLMKEALITNPVLGDTHRALFVVDEFRESELTTKDISNNIKAMLIRNELSMDNIEMFVIDPASKGTQQTSGQSMMDQLQEEGWPFVPGVNDVMAGINRTTRLLRDNRLFISRRCPKTISEMHGYHWKEWSENTDQSRSKPYKVGDDVMDTMRYVIMSRPDYYEHPQLDIYGRVIPEGGDPITGYIKETDDYLTEASEEMDGMMTGDSVLDF